MISSTATSSTATCSTATWSAAASSALRSTPLARPDAPPTYLTTAGAYARRTVLQYMRSPQLLVVNAVTSVMFLLVFRYVFGGAIDSGPFNYANFLISGLCAVAGLFAGGVVGVAEDSESGFFDRLRSLPVPRSAVLVGRSMADTALISWNVVVTVVVGFAVGFRPSGGIAGFVGGLALCVVFASAFSWLHIFMGLASGTAQAAQGMQFAVFPLIFVSSAYVPVESMPGWLQPIAQHQPVTAMVDSVRALMLGGDTQAIFGMSTTSLVLRALAWSIIIAGVFGALSVRRFQET